MRDLRDISRLAAALRENLAKCAANPDVDPVHDVRTGTRRLQATVESLVRELPEGERAEAVREAAAAMLRVLRKIRRAAGEVRDLDVHRKLLGKLAKRALGPQKGSGGEASRDAPASHQPEPIAQPEALDPGRPGLPGSRFSAQVEHLDAWLKHRRATQAERLQAQTPAFLARFDTRLKALESALGAEGLRLHRRKSPAVLALETFARLATEMQSLHAGNLHDFRKGAKKARYVAELAASADAEASQVGGALKKLQDEIGDWHDWLVLAEEAHQALGEDAVELAARIEQQRDQHFSAAVQTAARLRGRLMGEWLAVARAPARRRRAPRRSAPAPRSPATS